jgi:N-methylhydantoinase A
MREVGIRTMLIPPHPGVLCALGCAIADIRYDLSQTVEQPLSNLEESWIAEVLASQRQDGERRLSESEADVAETVVSHAAEMSYQGQIHPLRVPIGAAWAKDRVAESFRDAYRREYGNTLGDIPLMLVSLKTAVRGVRAQVRRIAEEPRGSQSAEPSATRPVHFGRWIDTPIYDRAHFRPGTTFTGPAIIEQSDTTTVIEPGMSARVDAFYNILVEVA